eukprot:TRINITY_DN8038_c0_g1_i1.p1 TRINITY_DN8038_c0_g1~~TRINITY_DN8038_c0_g1_i1.p1  ORF type:complete len:462 (+),score=102.90 TRINITY_DN8038_c0_g1_i1:67-1452(+)
MNFIDGPSADTLLEGDAEDMPALVQGRKRPEEGDENDSLKTLQAKLDDLDFTVGGLQLRQQMDDFRSGTRQQPSSSSNSGFGNLYHEAVRKLPCGRPDVSDSSLLFTELCFSGGSSPSRGRLEGGGCDRHEATISAGTSTAVTGGSSRAFDKDCSRCFSLSREVSALSQSLAGLGAQTVKWSAGLSKVRRRDLFAMVLAYILPCKELSEDLLNLCEELEHLRSAIEFDKAYDEPAEVVDLGFGEAFGSSEAPSRSTECATLRTIQADLRFWNKATSLHSHQASNGSFAFDSEVSDLVQDKSDSSARPLTARSLHASLQKVHCQESQQHQNKQQREKHQWAFKQRRQDEDAAAIALAIGSVHTDRALTAEVKAKALPQKSDVRNSQVTAKATPQKSDVRRIDPQDGLARTKTELRRLHTDCTEAELDSYWEMVCSPLPHTSKKVSQLASKKPAEEEEEEEEF